MHENAPPGFIWDRDVGAFLSSSYFWKWDELRFDEHVFLHLIFGAGHYESLMYIQILSWKGQGDLGKQVCVCVFCMYVCIFCVYGTTVTTTVVVVDHDVVDDDDVVACGDSVEFGKRFFQLQVIMLQSWDVYTYHQHHYCYCYRYSIVVIYSCYVVLLFQSLSLSLSCTSISHCLRAFQVGELLQKMFINAYICFLRTAWPFADCEIQEPIGSWHRKLVLYTRIFQVHPWKLPAAICLIRCC